MNLKKENGSILIFVLIGLLFMSAFLIIEYSKTMNDGKVIAEQSSIVNDIYNPNNDNGISYNKAYVDLRKKNKQEMTVSNELEDSKFSLILNKTYIGNIINYKIYGSALGVGELSSDVGFENKYKILLKVWKKDEDENLTDENKTEYYSEYYFYLENQLMDGEYIEFNTKLLTKADLTQETVDLPTLPTYEDYTKIEVITTNAPSKIEATFIGYTFENVS